MRIGHGFDIHRLIEHKKLKLAGVEIPFHQGFLAHSDGDVVLHAVTDAICGALAFGDIGQHFPDTDETIKNIDSALILKKIYQQALAQNYQISNLDVTILAEQPKLATYIPSMRQSLATILQTAIENISIKAKTMEKLGPIGEGQAIAAEVIVLLRKI